MDMEFLVQTFWGNNSISAFLPVMIEGIRHSIENHGHPQISLQTREGIKRKKFFFDTSW